MGECTTNVDGSVVSLGDAFCSAGAGAAMAGTVSVLRSTAVSIAGVFSAYSSDTDGAGLPDEPASGGSDAEVLIADTCLVGEWRTPLKGNSTPAAAPIPALSATIGMPVRRGTRTSLSFTQKELRRVEQVRTLITPANAQQPANNLGSGCLRQTRPS